MRAVLVGEAWGRAEAQFQHPLVGQSGRELTLQLGLSGFAPFLELLCRKCKNQTRFLTNFCEHCHEYIWPNEFHLMDYWKKLKAEYSIHVTNVFNMRPNEKNDIGVLFSTERETEMPSYRVGKTSGGTHLMGVHFHHLKRLWRELEDLKPNLVVAMGNCPSWALLGQTKITELRGTVHWSERLGVKVLPTFHPANILRNTRMRPTTLADFTKASREIQFPEIRRPDRFITVPAPNESGLHEIREWLNRPASTYSNDIETIRGQISIVGFARSASDALVIPFRDCHTEKGHIVDVGKIAASIGFVDGGINFWPTHELESAAWKYVIEAETGPKEKIFQNGLYDMSYFIKMGIHPRNARHDTMLWHHSQYPELPKSLGYLGSIYCNDLAWKQMRNHDTIKRDE